MITRFDDLVIIFWFWFDISFFLSIHTMQHSFSQMARLTIVAIKNVSVWFHCFDPVLGGHFPVQKVVVVALMLTTRPPLTFLHHFYILHQNFVLFKVKVKTKEKCFCYRLSYCRSIFFFLHSPEIIFSNTFLDNVIFNVLSFQIYMIICSNITKIVKKAEKCKTYLSGIFSPFWHLLSFF